MRPYLVANLDRRQKLDSRVYTDNASEGIQKIERAPTGLARLLIVPPLRYSPILEVPHSTCLAPIQKLPTELIEIIVDFMTDETRPNDVKTIEHQERNTFDALCFAVTCRQSWNASSNRVRNFLLRTFAPWSNNRLIVANHGSKAPEDMLNEQDDRWADKFLGYCIPHYRRLQYCDECDLDDLNPMKCYQSWAREPRCHWVMCHRYEMLEPVDRHAGQISLESDQDIRHEILENKIGTAAANRVDRLLGIDDASRPRPGQEWILRNLTKKQYVSSEHFHHQSMNEPTTFNTVLSVMLIRLVYHGTEQDALGKWAGDRIDVVREDFADFTNEDRAQWKDVSLVVKEAMKLGVEKWRKFLVEEESG